MKHKRIETAPRLTGERTSMEFILTLALTAIGLYTLARISKTVKKGTAKRFLRKARRSLLK